MSNEYESDPIAIVCATCGSDDVISDAIARWDKATQKWELTGLLDGNSCENCGEECKIKEVPLQVRA